jgi:bioD: dethiobiotin synthase
MKQNVYFVSGINTDAGKSYATGFLAREWNKNGHRTITQKFIQTGNVGHSEDIDLHRQIMGIPFTKEDQRGTNHAGDFLLSRLSASCFPAG